CDLGKNAFLGGGGLERKNAFQGFADFVFTNAEGDGVFLADGPAAQGQAQLIQEEFFENEALLGRRTKQIERFEGFAGIGEMGVDQSIAARRIVELLQEGGRQDVRNIWIEVLQGSVNGAA